MTSRSCFAHQAAHAALFLLAAIVTACGGGDDAALRAPWTRVPSPVDRDLHDVVLLGDEGWAVGDAGTLLTSRDGGATWATVSSPTSADLRRVYALADEALGAELRVVVGADGTVLVSADGGASFDVRRTGRERLVAFGPFATDDGSTYAAFGEADGDAVIVTSADLRTFTARPLRAGATINDAYVAGSEGWLVGDGGLVLETSDAGATFDAVEVGAGLTADLHAASGPGPILLGDGVVARRSVDGIAVAWSVSRASELPLLRDESAGHAIGTGADGDAILVTFTPTYDDWAAESLGIATRLEALAVTDDAVIAVGERGAIVRRPRAR
jgi:photosystem II stability/assembly factor-like uncharacterized protein